MIGTYPSMKDSLHQIFSTIKLPVMPLLGFAPTGMPRKHNGIELTQHGKKVEAACMKFSFKFNPNGLLLLELIYFINL